MPYISPDTVKQKRDAIKKAYPDYKFSIVRDHSSINIAILAGPVMLTEKKDEPVNCFYIKDHFKAEVATVLQGIADIAKAGNYTESTDGDYGNIPSFYVSMHIGQWDKPFVYTGK